MRVRLALGVALATLLSVGVLAAQEQDSCVDCEEAEPKQKPGTHLIVEGNLGATTLGSGGFTFGAVFGAGGKLGSFPPRFYFVAELGHTEVSTDTRALDFSFSQKRRYTDLGVGPRVYVPIYGPVRIFGDAIFGQTLASIEVDGPELGLVQHESVTRLAQLGVGVQVRVLHSLSVGVRAKWAWNPGPSLFVGNEPVGDAGRARGGITATLTGHF